MHSFPPVPPILALQAMLFPPQDHSLTVQITLGTFTAGLVQATYLPGTTIFAVSVQTTFTLSQISVAVLQVCCGQPFLSVSL